MRIDELLKKPEEIKQFKQDIDSNTGRFGIEHEDVRFDLRDYMAKYGFKELGAGGFGSVFKHPGKDYVMKIFGESPGYLKWIGFCKENPANPYLPKFVNRPVKIHESYYAIRMELLAFKDPSTQVRESNALAALVDKSDSLYNHDSKPHDVLRKEYADTLLKVFPNYLTDRNLKTAALAIKRIAANDGGLRHALDVRDENIMYRGDQLVITDPLAS